MGQIEIEAPERFYAVDFSASLAEDSETDLFQDFGTLTKSGQTCPLDFGAKTLPPGSEVRFVPFA